MKHGKEKETYTYSDAFKFGLAISFCSSLIAAGYYYLHIMFLFPDFISQFTDALYMGLEQAGATNTDINIDKLLDRMPVIVTVFQLIYFNILGLLWSSILANGTRHKVNVTPFD